MKKLLYLLSVIFMHTAMAQSQTTGKKFSLKAAQVYLEALGPGIFYSVNYDQRLAKKENGFGIRLGASRYRADDGRKRSTVPVQLNYLLGNRGRYLEVGVGATYGGGKDISNPVTGDFVGNATIGYRRQPYQRKGLTWRLALTPFIIFEPERTWVLPWVGGSVGFRF